MKKTVIHSGGFVPSKTESELGLRLNRENKNYLDQCASDILYRIFDAAPAYARRYTDRAKWDSPEFVEWRAIMDGEPHELVSGIGTTYIQYCSKTGRGDGVFEIWRDGFTSPHQAVDLSDLQVRVITRLD